ncbi:predicted protein [Naegleria gruberi]|uniref:Predicted protein n=1 Tax=Naegleria gruberi TaxID=5762 RepID=D2VJB7_NAEGR|nr:uncharacterized protein NAEGRDRAFT_68981 [Naegleria gruberi]EFC43010.1 predicted protein [Naegleria gruberi]|eukprot:XP_002675754.1 predicted protein [Naegleria gruberi strain NEG-M]
MVKILEGSVTVLEFNGKDQIPTSEEFYNQYIKFRKPVIIKNYISLFGSEDSEWKKVKEEWQLGISSSNQEEMVKEMKERELEMLNYWKNRFNNLDVFVSELRENGLSHPPNYEKVIKLSAKII